MVRYKDFARLRGDSVIDWEKLIDGLTKCSGKFNCGKDGQECPYYDWYGGPGDCIDHMLRDALYVLHSMEPKNPRKGGDGVTWWYECGECGTAIDPGDNFCRKCGKAVQWK